jgi:hypothetical protein
LAGGTTGLAAGALESIREPLLLFHSL